MIIHTIYLITNNLTFYELSKLFFVGVNIRNFFLLHFWKSISPISSPKKMLYITRGKLILRAPRVSLPLPLIIWMLEMYTNRMIVVISAYNLQIDGNQKACHQFSCAVYITKDIFVEIFQYFDIIKEHCCTFSCLFDINTTFIKITLKFDNDRIYRPVRNCAQNNLFYLLYGWERSLLNHLLCRV